MMKIDVFLLEDLYSKYPVVSNGKEVKDSSGIFQTKPRDFCPSETYGSAQSLIEISQRRKVSQRRSTITVGMCPAWDSLLAGLKGAAFGCSVRQYHGNAEYGKADKRAWRVEDANAYPWRNGRCTVTKVNGR